MSSLSKVIDKAFHGNKTMRNCINWEVTGAPTEAAKVGTLAWNTVDGDAYICTVAAGTWVKLNA